MIMKRFVHLALFLLWCLPAIGQDPVALCSDWVATVDGPTQQIVLRWRPTDDTMAMGYHICTGTPCLDYDTVFGRFDTSYVCADHDPLTPHTYRLHVFDSAYNVSALTPSFGNMVLSADVPQCETSVQMQWTPYTGMPTGLYRYSLMVWLEPFSDDYSEHYYTDSAGTRSFRFILPEGTTRVHAKVLAISNSRTIISQSNIVSVERLTVDSARFVEISDVVYDSVGTRVNLRFHVDTSYHVDSYTLWRSVDGSPWARIATIAPDGEFPVYEDRDINPYDSLHCYQLSVSDACGMNEKYSETRCVVVPDPPPPAIAIPNAIKAGDPDNGIFCPRVRGLKGNLYELNIYNRSGSLIFTTTDPARGWDPNAEPRAPQGVYAYHLRLRFNDNRIKTYAGSILVIR